MSASLPPSTSPSADGADTKLRLMCRYGGQIVPRPRSNSLCYLGGETRIISLNQKTIGDFSSFVSHLSSSLAIQAPFSIKYQLPSQKLDSLVSLSSDEDFHLMVDEQLSFSSSGRIRFFLFFSNLESIKTQNVIHHPKTEDWFVDALKSAKILQKAGGRLMDFDGESVNGISSLAESTVLETSSSFGSSSSSASSLNVPPIKAYEEHGSVKMVDNIVKLPFCESIETLSSGCGFQTVGSDSKIGTHQELNLKVSSNENCVSANHVNLGNQTHIYDPSARNPVHNMNELSGNSRFSQLYPVQEPMMLFVQSGADNVPQNLPSKLPIPSYYPMQPQMFHYQQNPTYPFRILPQVMSLTNFPMHFSIIDSPIAPSMHANPTMILPQVTYKEESETPSVLNICGNKPYDEREQHTQPPQSGRFPRSMETSYYEVSNFVGEFDDVPDHTQIYKSQPPPPPFPSQFRAESKVSKISLPQ